MEGNMKTNLNKTPEELAKEMDAALDDKTEMTPEEKAEYDAAHGYFQGDNND